MYCKKAPLGFTLIELLLVVSIIGIIAAVAYPSYQDFVLKGNRTEGQRELLRMANMQEQVYVDTKAYTEDMKQLGAPADPYITESGFYSIDATVNGNSFVLTATAKKAQIKDTGCTSLTINEAGETTPATGCWEK